MTPGRKDNVYTGKKNGVKTYEQKRYLLCKIRDIQDILNSGELIEQGHNDSFSGTFGCKLKFTLLYEFLKDHNEYIFNRDIPQWSCLCDACENVSLLANGINKLLPSKVPTSPHDIVEEFSCCNSKSCMFDGSCTSCSEIEIVVPGSQNGTNGEHFVEFFEWGKSAEGMVKKFQSKMGIVGAISLLKQQIVVLKSHLFTKRTQLECYNNIK